MEEETSSNLTYATCGSSVFSSRELVCEGEAVWVGVEEDESEDGMGEGGRADAEVSERSVGDSKWSSEEERTEQGRPVLNESVGREAGGGEESSEGANRKSLSCLSSSAEG